MSDCEWKIHWDGGWNCGFRGETVLSGVSELAAILASRDPNGNAEFTLYLVEQEYPFMMLAVSNDRWYVHFFPEADEAGAFAVGDDPTATGVTQMLAGSNIEVENSSLIDGSVALRLAAELMKSRRRPVSAEWFDL
jgi:hypothetical protein